MNTNLLVAILGGFYAILFSLISTLEREGISLQFLFEVLLLTSLAAGGGYLSGTLANPFLFLLFIYLTTMRSRLLSDLANFISKRGRHREAISMLEVAQRLLPDRSTRLVIQLNLGIVYLRTHQFDLSQSHLESVLEKAETGGLGIRNRTACLYYVGHALLQQGQISRAKKSLRSAINLFPNSPYGKAAAQSLSDIDQVRRKKD
jgi:tetratricopeptide (TPR) repeat protein